MHWRFFFCKRCRFLQFCTLTATSVADAVRSIFFIFLVIFFSCRLKFAVGQFGVSGHVYLFLCVCVFKCDDYAIFTRNPGPV